MRVWLDVGHGCLPEGKFDPGSWGPGVCEHDLALICASRVQTCLSVIGIESKLILGPLSFKERGEKAEDGIFVSIHLNAFNKSAQGTETITCVDPTDDDQMLARSIQAEVVELLELPDRGVKQRSLAVLKAVPGGVPAVLCEPFFCDAVDEFDKAIQMAQLAAAGIARGIQNYFKKNGVSQHG